MGGAWAGRGAGAWGSGGGRREEIRSDQIRSVEVQVAMGFLWGFYGGFMGVLWGFYGGCLGFVGIRPVRMEFESDGAGQVGRYIDR